MFNKINTIIMSLIKWNDEIYSVDLQQIDEHHKTLVGLINNLHESMLEGKGKDVMDGLLNELNKYTVYHFGAEEDLMVKHGYPEEDFKAHKKEHDSFKAKLEDLLEKYQNEERTISIETFKFLKEWLTNHIQKVDKKFAPFLKSKGVA